MICYMQAAKSTGNDESTLALKPLGRVQKLGVDEP